MFLEHPYKDGQRKDWTESIYRLSGLQEGMLFHGLYEQGGGAYIEQLGCDLVEPDLVSVRRSWELLLKGHSILRSAFYNDAFSIPVQCVYREIEMPVEELDYRGMSIEEQGVAIKAYKAE